MKISSSYFVVQNVGQGDNGTLRLAGQFILNGTTEVVSSPGSQPEERQPVATIEMARLLEVKWVLPPEGSMFYDAIKGFAEGMGYETVEHEDFSYPRR